MTTPVTASMLYDLVSCPHRVTMDLFADPAQREWKSFWMPARYTERQAAGRGAVARYYQRGGG